MFGLEFFKVKLYYNSDGVQSVQWLRIQGFIIVMTSSWLCVILNVRLGHSFRYDWKINVKNFKISHLKSCFSEKVEINKLLSIMCLSIDEVMADLLTLQCKSISNNNNIMHIVIYW